MFKYFDHKILVTLNVDPFISDISLVKPKTSIGIIGQTLVIVKVVKVVKYGSYTNPTHL